MKLLADEKLLVTCFLEALPAYFPALFYGTTSYGQVGQKPIPIPRILLAL